MEEVAATLKGLGIDPMMAEATVHRMDWAAGLGLRERFQGEFPKTYKEVLDAICSAPTPGRRVRTHSDTDQDEPTTSAPA